MPGLCWQEGRRPAQRPAQGWQGSGEFSSSSWSQGWRVIAPWGRQTLGHLQTTSQRLSLSTSTQPLNVTAAHSHWGWNLHLAVKKKVMK